MSEDHHGKGNQSNSSQHSPFREMVSSDTVIRRNKGGKMRGKIQTKTKEQVKNGI